MPRARRSGSSEVPVGRRVASLARLAVAAALVLGPSAAARANGDLLAQADFSLAQNRTLALTEDYFRQFYLVQYKRAVLPPLMLRLACQYQEDRGTLSGGVFEGPVLFRVVTPRASMDYGIEGLSLRLAWDYSYRETLEGGVWQALQINRLMTSVSWFPVANFEVGLYGFRNAYALALQDTVDQQAQLRLVWMRGAEWRLEASNTVRRYTQAPYGVDRELVNPRLFAQYWGIGPGYNVLLRYNADYFWSEQRITASGSAPSDVQPVAGLHVVDDIPIATPPMAPEPRLIDGVLEVSAGISLGPGGVSFQNLGVDMGVSVTLDELRVVVRDGAGQPVPFGGPVSWAVYWSQDGTRWVQVVEAAAAYDLGNSAYFVEFPPTNARFFKVVNFGLNTVDTLVTELQTFLRVSGGTVVSRGSKILRQSFSLQGTVSPWNFLRVNYTGLVAANWGTQFGGSTAWWVDLNNFLEARLGPFSGFTFGATGAQTRSSPPVGVSQDSVATTGFASYQPFNGLMARAEGRWARDVVGVQEATTTGAGLSGYVVPYEALRVTASGMYSQQQISGGGSTDYVTGSMDGYVTLVRDLDLWLEIALQRNVVSVGDVSAQLEVPLFRIVNYQRSFAELHWRPSRVLELFARFGYARTELGNGPFGRYQINWDVFPGGAVQTSLLYLEEIDPITGRSYRNGVAQVQWQVNRVVRLVLSYNGLYGTGSVPMMQQTVFLLLGFRI
jgi:hypothetical protein